MNELKKLTISDISQDMQVIDNDGDTGTIKKYTDPHNVVVEYTKGGTGLFCMVGKCDMYDRGYLIKIEN